MLGGPQAPATEWILNLLEEKILTLNSSQSVIDEVSDRQERRIEDGYEGLVKEPVSVNQFRPPVQSSLRPISLLHRIGRATTPLVPNLADLSATWALYRYIWAFSHSSDHLNLTDIAKNIDFHQKAVLSDEVGVGMAFWTMSEFFDAGQPIDVDVAIRNPQLAGAMGFPDVETVASTSPDYIYPLPNDNYAVVECKGSQSGKNQSMKQLRRGLEQVPSVRFANAQQADEYVVATKLSRSDVEVYVIDPPGDKDKDGKEKRSLEVRDKVIFDREIDNLTAASKLAYSGADALAREFSRIETEDEFVEGRREPPEVLELPELDAEVRGQEATFPSRSNLFDRLTVFMGVEATVYDSIAGRDIDEEATEVVLPDRFREAIPEGSKIGAFGSDDNQLAISIDDDGTVFSVMMS